MDGYPSVLCLVMRGKPSFDFKSVALLEGFDFYEQFHIEYNEIIIIVLVR